MALFANCFHAKGPIDFVEGFGMTVLRCDDKILRSENLKIPDKRGR